jgi:hypothetical protein
MRASHVLAFLTSLVLPLGAQTSARAALLATDLATSDSIYRTGVVSVLPAVLGHDGVLVWPGAAVLRGDSAAAGFFKRQLLLTDARISWQPFRIEIAADSSLAIMAGVAVVERPATPPVDAIHRIGRYVAAWQRVGSKWQLAALAVINLFANGENTWNPLIGPAELPLLPSTGPAAAFIAADSAFAADAAAMGASRAFAKWAAPDATTFAATGELNVGPARIGAVLASNSAHWEWGAVAAGSSTDGTLGWTVGQATITPSNGGQPAKSKYMTLWRKLPDGSIRFIADGGSARP